MVKKNTKADIEPKKADQTGDLQEYEDPEFTGNHENFTENPVTEITEMTENIENQEDPVEFPENPVESTEITKNPKDKSETTMGMIYCKHYDKDITRYYPHGSWENSLHHIPSYMEKK